MKLYIKEKEYIDTDYPLDLSMALRNNDSNPKAWYVNPPVFEPVRTGNYIGSVKEGGSVNFRDIYFNPHGHGTHTECLGHITEEVFSINKTLDTFFFKAYLISVNPDKLLNEDGAEDQVLYPKHFELIPHGTEAIVIRTLPNNDEKKTKDYSTTNPPYLDVTCAKYLLEKGIKHLLIDLPSVDRENDHGVLAFHHAFWDVPHSPNFERTITELIYVENTICDGEYILNLHVAPFENDAAPSRPILYKKELNKFNSL